MVKTAANTGLPSLRASPFVSGGVILLRRDQLCKFGALPAVLLRGVLRQG